MDVEADGFPSLFDSQELEEVRLRQWASEHPQSAPYQPFQRLEQAYPRIALLILQLWGTPEMDRYFERLLIDDRGDRAGFPPDIMEALLSLSRRHLTAYRYPTPRDVWEVDPDVKRHAHR